MKLSAIVASLSLYASASEFQALVDTVNADSTSTWTAGVPERFGSLEDVKTLCGTRLRSDPDYQKVETPQSHYDKYPIKDLPPSFDARTNWPKCTVISKVRDQSACGSCWAFSATEAFEGSRCVATGEDVEFSTDDTAGCCSGFLCGMSQGCNGGQQVAALHWTKNIGVVSGGDYQSKDVQDLAEGCKPYELAPCAHHVPPSAKYPKCPQEEYSIRCKRECSNTAYNSTYKGDKKKSSQASQLMTIEGMQTAIMKTGPLAVSFTVYGDFPTYKSGVYTHKSGQMLGGHAVSMVGWGEENGTPYWLIKNSWNEQWGDGGFFKIARGTDECGIEDDVGAVHFSQHVDEPMKSVV